jgi:hypothetical protein
MPVRPPTPVDRITRPTNPEERALVALQRKISATPTLLEERDQLMARLYGSGPRAGGTTQRRLADLLTLGAHQAGDLSGVSENTVQRALRIQDGRATRSHK